MLELFAQATFGVIILNFQSFSKTQQNLAKIDTQQKKIEELEKDTHGKNLSNEIGIITTKIEDYSQCDPKTGR